MAFVIAELCIGTKDTACVDAWRGSSSGNPNRIRLSVCSSI